MKLTLNEPHLVMNCNKKSIVSRVRVNEKHGSSVEKLDTDFDHKKVLSDPCGSMCVNRLGDHAEPRIKPVLQSLHRRCMHLKYMISR
jgi:hypothetical protein